MTNKRHLGFAASLVLTVACATTKRSGPVIPDAGNLLTDRMLRATAAAAANRSRLDSVVLELHRLSGDTSASSLARSRKLRAAVRPIDSSYRASLADLLWTVNASTADVTPENARFPIDAAPTPLLRGFVDGANWMLLSPVIHELGKNGPYMVIVPRGFVTDLASIPQPLQILRGRSVTSSRYANAALVHDYLYWRQDCTRAQSDNIMAITMMEAGVPLIERRLVHEGVKAFGQSAWEGNRKARQAGFVRTVAPPHDQVPPTGTWAEYREWLRATRVREGLEYRVPQSVCTMADSVRIPE